MVGNAQHGFDTFCPELWMKIVEKMTDLYDVENLCLAYVKLRHYVESELTKRKQQKALTLVLQNGFISAANGLKMRTVSKDWRELMDGFYNRQHVYRTCLPRSLYPTVRLKVPLDEARAKILQDFMANPNCQFIGGRFTLMLAKTKEPIWNPIEDEAFKSVWRRVTHLSIEEEDWFDYDNQQILEICSPLLRQMSTLISISCNLDYDVELILRLANPETLEVIKTEHTLARRQNSDEWGQVFTRCKSNLKIFDCNVLSPGMQTALSNLVFENLEELRLDNHYWYHDEDHVDRPCEEDGCDYVLNLSENGAKERFPKLKRVSIPFLHASERVFEEQEEWILPELLTDLSNNIDTIEEIEIRLCEWYDLPVSLENYPISREIFGRGSSTVRKLVINDDYDDALDWFLQLTNVWQNLSSLQIGTTQLVKGGRAWIKVGKIRRCTECS